MLSCVMKLQAADYANWKLQQLICTLQTDPQSEGRPTSCNIHSKPLEYNTWLNPNILSKNWHWHKIENLMLMQCIVQEHNNEKVLTSFCLCLETERPELYLLHNKSSQPADTQILEMQKMINMRKFRVLLNFLAEWMLTSYF